MSNKTHIKKGDLVKVIAGNGKHQKVNTGRVLEVDPRSQRAIVEGLNLASKHSKPSTASPQGGIVKKEAAIHLSNLMLIDPKSGEPSRVGRKKDKDGKLVRYAKRSGATIQ